MPRKAPTPAEAAATGQRNILWGMGHDPAARALTNWDPDTARLVQAILLVVESGATLVIRPGSGSRSIGVAIWEGDMRHPPTWVYDEDELNTWAQRIGDISQGRNTQAAD